MGIVEAAIVPAGWIHVQIIRSIVKKKSSIPATAGQKAKVVTANRHAQNIQTAIVKQNHTHVIVDSNALRAVAVT